MRLWNLKTKEQKSITLLDRRTGRVVSFSPDDQHVIFAYLVMVDKFR